MNRITRIAIIAAIFIALNGCATSGISKFQPLDEGIIKSHKGDMEGIWDVWIKPNANQMHKAIIGGKWLIPYSPPGPENIPNEVATEKTIIDGFQRFCKTSGADSFINKEEFGKSINCTNSSTNEFIGKVETERYNDGLVVWIDTPRIREAQKDAEYEQLAHPELLGRKELSQLVAKYQKDDPKNLIPGAQKHATELWQEEVRQNAEKIAAYQQKIELDNSVRRQRQEHMQVGDQVCTDGKGSIEQSTGNYINGQPQYQTIEGNNHIVGFVEKVSGKKVQIRISGINFLGNNGQRQSLDSLSNFNGGSTLKVNSIIWDSIYNWEGCQIR